MLYFKSRQGSRDFPLTLPFFISKYKALHKGEKCMENITTLFASKVFNDSTMKKYLPEAVYRYIKEHGLYEEDN